MPVVVAMFQQGIENGVEDTRLMSAEVIAGNQFERGACFRLMLVVPTRVVPAVAKFYLVGGQTEKEEVLLSGCLGHFNGGAIACADGQRAVHHELHIAR